MGEARAHSASPSFMAKWVWVVAVGVVSVAGCAEQRKADVRGPNDGPPEGVESATKCRYESATATSSIEVASLVALDLPADKTRTAIKCSGGPLQECAGAMRDESARGEVTYTLTVDTRGFVTDAQPDETKLAPKITACATQILKRLELPPPDKQTTVKVGLRYAQRDDSGGRFAGASVTQKTEILAGKSSGAAGAVDAALGRMRACYLLALEREATAAGVLDAELEIAADGTVASHKVTQRGTILKETVACADVVLGAAAFPKPEVAPLKVKARFELKKIAAP